MKDVLFIDIDGVIMSKNFIDGCCPPTSGSFDSIRELKDKRFGCNIFIISNSSSIDDRFKVINWLSRKEFYSRTGVPIQKLIFCDQETEKADICEKEKATHFVGSCKETMIYLRRVGVKNRLLFVSGNEEKEDAFDFILPDVVRVESWQEIKKILLG
ncbi:MAG: hypothetical protein FJZ43_02445 [Candidatus Staskawiczbacteria bacterium]|nr:hypothetical protein [Candidatus Staskawiczbacteria bacterium]